MGQRFSNPEAAQPLRSGAGFTIGANRDFDAADASRSAAEATVTPRSVCEATVAAAADARTSAAGDGRTVTPTASRRAPAAFQPWLQELNIAVVGFLDAASAVALDRCSRATRCVGSTAPVRIHGDYNQHRQWYNVLGSFATPPPPNAHTARVDMMWSDQGWGNRKGRVYVVVDLPGKGPTRGATPRKAPHGWQRESIWFRPREGENYGLWFFVGGGGGPSRRRGGLPRRASRKHDMGHSLHVRNIRMRCLVYRRHSGGAPAPSPAAPPLPDEEHDAEVHEDIGRGSDDSDDDSDPFGTRDSFGRHSYGDY